MLTGSDIKKKEQKVKSKVDHIVIMPVY